MASSDLTSETIGGWHALVIGVDRYPAYPGRQLAGCTNDADAMCRFLIDRVQIAESRVHRLLSPRQDSAASTRATAANIRRAFTDVTSSVAVGDHVVLYLAGHGIRLAREIGGAKDRYYGFVPEDVAPAATGYANVILGREIYEFLRAIEMKKASATVIADTCHSGGSTRAIDANADVNTRSLDIDPLSEEEWQRFVAGHPTLGSNMSRGLGADAGVTSFGGYPGGGFVMLTGCLDAETAKECKDVVIGADGSQITVSHGLLTYTLLKELEREPADTIRTLRWMDLHDRLRATVAQRAMPMGQGPQTPALEGRPEKTVFGGAWRPFDPGFTVRMSADGRLTIDGGEIHGLDAGATVAIYPPDTADFDTAVAVDAVIVSATAVTSTARLVDPARHVIDRSRARLVRPSATVPPIVLCVAADPTPVPDWLRDALRSVETDAQMAITADATVACHIELRRWHGLVPQAVWSQPGEWAGARDGWVLVKRERFGAPAPHAPKELTADEIVAYLPDGGGAIDHVTAEERPGIIARGVVNALRCWAHYFRARERHAADEMLKSWLDVRLRFGEGESRVDHMDALRLLESKSGAFTITDTDWLWAEIRVKKSVTHLDLHTGWIVFSDDGNIEPLWPAQGEIVSFAAGDVVYVGRNIHQALPLGRRADQRSSAWTLRLVACTAPSRTAPLDIWSMAQESAQDAFASAFESTRGAARRSPRPRKTPAVEQPAWYAWTFRVMVTA